MTLAAQQLEVLAGPTRQPGLGICLDVIPTVETGRGFPYPTQAVIVTTAARRLITMSKAGEKLESILVRGDFDPTLHPHLREIASNLKELQRKWYPKALLALATDGLHLENPDVRTALRVFDRVLLRLEYGTQKTFAALAGGKPKDLKDVVDRLASLDIDRIVVQATFGQGDVENSSEGEVKAWIGHVSKLRPKAVQIQNAAKGVKGRRPISKGRLDEIAAKLREKTGFSVEVLAE
jgi:wyosine [tRNA(Phe)-imidazoG37] synthetase (radical SAM superfamily)